MSVATADSARRRMSSAWLLVVVGANIPRCFRYISTKFSEDNGEPIRGPQRSKGRLAIMCLLESSAGAGAFAVTDADLNFGISSSVPHLPFLSSLIFS